MERGINMSAKNFELWMGCFGNGITVCNKAVEKNGDYKSVCHISNAGNIEFYVKKSYIPQEAMSRIEEVAEENRRRFIEQLKLELKHNPIKTYGKMYEGLSISDTIKFSKESEGMSIAEKIKLLMPIYIRNN